MEDVHLWMIDQHLGRRSVSDFQRGVLALRKRDILAERRAKALATADVPDATPSSNDQPGQALAAAPLHTRADIAKAARLSSGQVVQIEKIQKQAAPELVAALKAGTISINAAAAVASLPTEEQKTVALAGKDELKQAAKRVREGQRKPTLDEAELAKADEVQSIKERVAVLTAENLALRAQVSEIKARSMG